MSSDWCASSANLQCHCQSPLRKRKKNSPAPSPDPREVAAIREFFNTHRPFSQACDICSPFSKPRSRVTSVFACFSNLRCDRPSRLSVCESVVHTGRATPPILDNYTCKTASISPLRFGARYSAAMPSRDWLLVSFPLKQFFTAPLLRISAIQNLDPGAALALCDVRAELVVGDDSLQVQLANLLKQGTPRVVEVRQMAPCVARQSGGAFSGTGNESFTGEVSTRLFA